MDSVDMILTRIEQGGGLMKKHHLEAFERKLTENVDHLRQMLKSLAVRMDDAIAAQERLRNDLGQQRRRDAP